MDTPNDIDVAIVDAKLDGLNQMYLAAVESYRQGLIDTLSRFAREFVYEVHAIRLIADVDWRWCFDGFVNAAGEDIEADFGQYEVEDMELFSSAFLSELDDFEAGTGYVYVTERKFSPVWSFAEHVEQHVEQVVHEDEVESSSHFYDEHGLSREERERHYGQG